MEASGKNVNMINVFGQDKKIIMQRVYGVLLHQAFQFMTKFQPLSNSNKGLQNNAQALTTIHYKMKRNSLLLFPFYQYPKVLTLIHKLHIGLQIKV